MEESVTYQAILRKGRAEEARRILLRLGRIRFVPPDEAALIALNAITDVDRLERLSERVLVAATWEQLLATL